MIQHVRCICLVIAFVYALLQLNCVHLGFCLVRGLWAYKDRQVSRYSEKKRDQRHFHYIANVSGSFFCLIELLLVFACLLLLLGVVQIFSFFFSFFLSFFFGWVWWGSLLNTIIYYCEGSSLYSSLTLRDFISVTEQCLNQ